MPNNGTEEVKNGKTPNEGQCPVWCVRHERYDVGHRDEGVLHLGRRRTYRGHAFYISQDRLLREGRNGQTTFWLDEEELTPAQAKRLGQLLIDTAAGS